MTAPRDPGGRPSARTVATLSTLLVVVLTLAACGNGTKSDGSTPPAAAEATSPTPAAAQSPTAQASPSGSQAGTDSKTATSAYFQLPSGNLGCHMEGNATRCDIQGYTYKPPARPAGCEGEYGRTMRFEKGRVATFICTGDGLLPAPDVLAYGKSVVVNRMQCTSETTGVSCYDLDSGHGFALSKTEYRFLEPS